jgi:hypothetical protein
VRIEWPCFAARHTPSGYATDEQMQMQLAPSWQTGVVRP